MFIPIDQLPPEAKVWIYQADKKFSPDAKNILTSRLRSFTDEWLVHGAPLEASFSTFYDQFVVIAANDTASGCSIDTSVKVMKELGRELNIDFFDRTSIAFRLGDEIMVIPHLELKQKFIEGVVGPDSLVFNNAISTLQELTGEWPAPAEKTWLKRYITPETIKK